MLSYGVNKGKSIDVPPPQSDVDSLINAGELYKHPDQNQTNKQKKKKKKQWKIW